MLSAKARLVRPDKALSSTTPLRDSKPSKDPAICANCQAVWHKGKWSLDPSIRREVRRWGTPITVACPACRSAKEGNPTGILYLTGSFLARNRTEILNLVRNTARAAAAKNPLERIIRIQADSRHPLVVETTSEKLARRLGRAINKACGGALDIRFSHEDKLVRVYWRRDAAGSVA
jgi:hypothetical protein